MDDLAQSLSAEEKAYFGEEVVAEAIASEDGAPSPAETDATPEAKADPVTTTEKPAEKPAEDPAVQKTVPLAALHEARAEAKEMRAAIAAERERAARMEERFNQLTTALQRPAEQPKTVQEDPIAALERHEQMLAEQRQQSAAQQQAAEHRGRLDAFIEGSEAKFRTEAPDYDDAAKHLAESKRAEYAALGATPAQISQLLTRDVYALAQEAARLGRNPAEIAYNLAKVRGYTTAAPKTEEPPAVSADDKMTMLEKGTAAAKSLAAGGGGVNELSLASIAAMSPDEADEVISRLAADPALLRKIAGPGSR